jgi:hypothetical protein
VKMTANAARTATARIAIATSENKAGPWTLMILGRRGLGGSWWWDPQALFCVGFHTY